MSKHNAAVLVHIRSSIKLSIAFHVDMFTVLPRESRTVKWTEGFKYTLIIHIFTCINNDIERHRTRAISRPVQTVEWSWSAEVVATMWMEQQVHSRLKDLGHVRAERRWQQSESATATDTHTRTVLCTHLELWNFEVINYGTYIFFWNLENYPMSLFELGSKIFIFNCPILGKEPEFCTYFHKSNQPIKF